MAKAKLCGSVSSDSQVRPDRWLALHCSCRSVPVCIARGLGTEFECPLAMAQESTQPILKRKRNSEESHAGSLQSLASLASDASSLEAFDRLQSGFLAGPSTADVRELLDSWAGSLRRLQPKCIVIEEVSEPFETLSFLWRPLADLPASALGSAGCSLNWCLMLS